jgi:lipoprotein-anchoring transpeptidase ErfK/SrfK
MPVGTSRGAFASDFQRRSRPRRASSRAPLVAGALLLLLAGVLLAGMYLYDHSRRDIIANGVRIAGVDLGGLKPEAARRRLDSELLAPLRREVRVNFATHTFTITGRQARLSLDVNRLVRQALARSRSGSIFTRTLRGLLGGSVNANIPAAVDYDHAVVRALTARVRAAVDRPAQDATVQPSASGILTAVASQNGLHVDSTLLGARVQYSITHPNAPSSIAVPVHPVRPSVTTSQLAARYPSYIVVDRSTFTLRLYQHLKLTNSYPIAVGMQGLQTPAGRWQIQWMQVDPPWYVPHASWTGSLAGKVIPPGPADPLKARYMAFANGAGIHGIDPSEYGTIGHTASHGCIRMTIPDVIDLYSKVSVGTPVYIV